MDILGIDFGGTGIKGAVVNVQTGEMTTVKHRLPTPLGAKPEDVAEVVADIVHHFEWKGPVGCGVPGVVIEGMVYTAANIDKSWIGTNAVQLFSNAAGCPFSVINDADAAGIAEMTFGAGRGKSGVVLLLTLGTGIGSAIFVEGKLFPNTELGHLQIRGKDAEKRASDAVRKNKGLDWQEWAMRLNEYLNTLEALLYPDLIILGGGVSKKADYFFPYLKVRAKIVPAQMLNEAGIIGAALYAYSQFHR